jgi:hypothetical protein
MLRIRLVSTAFLFVSATSVSAQQDPARRVEALDPTITQVVTGGFWQVDSSRGQYRVVVLTEGWEEVRHRVFVQWLAEDTAARELDVQSSMDLAPLASEWWSLADPSLSLEAGSWILLVHAAAMPLEQHTAELRFRLGPPGRVAPLR